MVLSLFDRIKRNRLLEEPFPEAWLAIVDERLGYVKQMTPEVRARFLDHLKVFALEKEWVGVEGLTVTDEMKVIVAGAAARLSVHLDLHVYDDLGTVVIHPGALEKHDDGAVLGKAHRLGAIALSWNHVKHGLVAANDGHDVALHELAHVLDVSDGDFDGTPELDRPADVHAWARAFTDAYLRVKGQKAGHVLRAYAGTHEAEMFAVATEVFFEKPRQLKKKEPALYATLVKFYGHDPAA
jgi:MtfA peptidase